MPFELCPSEPDATLAGVCFSLPSGEIRKVIGPSPEAARALHGAAKPFILLGFVILLGGCASPGNPRPPSLHLQQIAAAPQAERLGDQVILTWTIPAATTDGGKPEPPLTAVVCREVVPTTAAAAPCTPVARLPTAPGSNGRAVDTLPPALLAKPDLLAYRVELLNRRGRSAGLSQPAFAVAGPAPAPAGPLALSGRAEGTLIAWAAAPSPGLMQVTRTPASAAPAKPAAPRPSSGLGNDPQAPVLLRPPDRAHAAAGIIDASVLDPRAEGVAFRYVAQRVETLTLAGHTLELHGLPSPPAVFAYAYTFPPPPPSGLLAIPAVSPSEIDLSWEPSASAEPLGYNVFRRGPGESAFSLLNARPVASLSYRDAAVVAGRTYVYRVTAVDRHKNQSAPSPEAQETASPGAP